MGIAMKKRTLVWALGFSLLLAGPVAAQQVGSVEEVVNVAYGTPPSAPRVRVAVTDAVVQDQTLETEGDSSLIVRFADDSLLTLGENSSAVIDEFVYSAGQGESSLNLVEGAFRYVSGNMPKENVTITTPTVTMGIRGTDLKISVAPDGTTRLITMSGLGFVRSKLSGQNIIVPAGFEVIIDRDGRFPGLAPAKGQGGGAIGDIAIDTGQKQTEDEEEGFQNAGVGRARARAIGNLTYNTSAIGSASGLAAYQGSFIDRYDDRPSGVVSSGVAIEGSGWSIADGDSEHFSLVLAYGPITAPDGSSIIAVLDNSGENPATTIIATQTFQIGLDQHFFTIEGLANFVTTEYPDYINSQFNDSVTIVLTTPGGVQSTITLADLFSASVNTSTFTPVQGLPPPLAGVNDGVAPGGACGGPDCGGQTGWSEFGQSVPVAPGGVVTLEIQVKNEGDAAYPSAGLVTDVSATGGN